jgi:hypothetical protein
MHSNTATTVEASTKATKVDTHPNTEGEEVVTNNPEVAMNHQKEGTLEQAREATIKFKHLQHNLKEGATLAKKEPAQPMVDNTQANGVQSAKNLPTTLHNAGLRRR